jgi:hypothetical protein
MCRRKTLSSWRLVLLTTALCWGAGMANAQQKPSVRPGPIPGQTIITDAAGRVHVRNPRITDAQRKAVAKRQQAARRTAAKKGN